MWERGKQDKERSVCVLMYFNAIVQHEIRKVKINGLGLKTDKTDCYSKQFENVLK